MLRDHRSLLVTFADKAAVRDYVAEAVGESYLPRVYGLFDTAEAMSTFEVPASCVIKPTHGSGAVVVVSPAAPDDACLPTPEGSWVYCHVARESFTTPELVAIGRAWLSQLYGQGPNREWAYGLIPRRIIVEELLAGEAGNIPDDYKIFVFHGRARYIQVDSGRFGRRTQDFFLPSWERLELSGGPPAATPQPACPDRLNEMLAIAERLGRDTDFVRVDLYVLPGRVVVGELTSYPAGGDSPFHPESFDWQFGQCWVVPRRYQ
jgi:TupA-like ATPgrasp